jgi:hypothetical protein
MPRLRLVTGIVAAAIGLSAAACKKPLSPEQQVRAAIAEAEQAAADKDLKRLGALVAEHYADPDGNDRTAVLNVLRLQFLRAGSVHLFVRVSHVELPGPDQARAVVYVALASVPVPSPDDLVRLNADLYRFELQFEREGKTGWRVLSARWSQARPEDLIGARP